MTWHGLTNFDLNYMEQLDVYVHREKCTYKAFENETVWIGVVLGFGQETLSLWNRVVCFNFECAFKGQQFSLALSQLPSFHYAAMMDRDQVFPETVNNLYRILQAIDPYWTEYVDFREPLEVWNYIIFTTPFILFVLCCQFIGFPIVLRFLHWAPKLLWPRLLGFPILHEIIRSFEHITDPRLPSIGDLIKHAEGTLNIVLDQLDVTTKQTAVI